MKTLKQMRKELDKDIVYKIQCFFWRIRDEYKWRKEMKQKCSCQKSKFTRSVDSEFNPLCGNCGKKI